MPNSVAYVFGKENYSDLCRWGYDARLLDERPLVPTAQFQNHLLKHKPLGWQATLQEFDEIIALDWDIRPAKQIDLEALFTKLREKSFLQANLLQYRRIKVKYRRSMAGSVPNAPIRQIPSGAFVYLRGEDGRHSVRRVLQIMDEKHHFTEEHAMAFFLDNLYGGWKGAEHWWELHEPFCCRLRRMEAITEGGKRPRPKEPLFHY